ncbi:MAG: hypothetical protein JWQ87_2008 [Candidatus Sulfotelmatobacter sp.]|nr:hypothetical protein [Candidatus Sulfotelmatobacter sp.]
MPKFLEDALKKGGRKKGLRGKRLMKYVFGGMNNIGAVHGSQITARGKRMEEKHEQDAKAGR